MLKQNEFDLNVGLRDSEKLNIEKIKDYLLYGKEKLLENYYEYWKDYQKMHQWNMKAIEHVVKLRKKLDEYQSAALEFLDSKDYLDEWLEQGKGVIRIGNHRMSNRISYDCESRNQEVSGYYKICGYDEDTWHEPLIEVKFGIKDRYHRISETNSFKEAYVDRDIGETLAIKNDL